MKQYTIPTFDFELLNGKSLRIYVSRNVDGTTVVGVDEENDVMYVLHQEINIEQPAMLKFDEFIVPGSKKKKWF